MKVFRLYMIPALVILIASAVVGCGEDEMVAQDRESKINALLNLLAEQGEGATIRLDSVTDFDWDKVYRFSHAFPFDQIKKIVGADVQLSQDVVGRLSSDMSSLLIFTKNDTVVYQLAVGPGVGRPTLRIEDPSGKAYTPETALMTVESYDPDGGHGALWFKE